MFLIYLLIYRGYVPFLGTAVKSSKCASIQTRIHDPVSEDHVTSNDSRENHILDKPESSNTFILQCNSIIQHIDVLHASKKLNAITWNHSVIHIAALWNSVKENEA